MRLTLEKTQSFAEWKLVDAAGETYGVFVGDTTVAGVLQKLLHANAVLALNEFERPTITCLCGSTRFMDAFQRANFEETLNGNIVLTVGCDTRSDDELFSGAMGERIKQGLDELHKQKIALADEILVLNVNGYVGSSTRGEIEHARSLGKRIRWLEPDKALAD